LKGPASTNGPLSLSEVSTAGSVSPDGQPLSISSTFLANTPVIYVTAKIVNAPEDTNVSARWVYVRDDAGKTINQQLSEDSATAKGTRYISFSRQASAGAWGSGQYSVSLLVNGKEMTNTQFTVQPVQKADVPAPTISFFKAVPEAISTGQSVTLSWNVTGATLVQISTIGTVPPVGNVIVTPVNSVEYQLTAKNNAGTTAMKTYITVTSFNTDKPELVITDFRVEGNKAYYKIKNIGGVNAKSSTTFLYIEGTKRSSSLADILPIGEEREQYFPNFEWTYGSSRTFKLPVRICADGLNQIGEYDENNNCLVVDW
ncbi:MAG: hypothetical protein EHM12_02100, partial [Dehalococcoidia bacterium]